MGLASAKLDRKLRVYTEEELAEMDLDQPMGRSMPMPMSMDWDEPAILDMPVPTLYDETWEKPEWDESEETPIYEKEWVPEWDKEWEEDW